jgi:putative hemolysin
MNELLLILVLLVINGVFAMTEIAIVSARRTRLKQRAEEGDSRARVALELAAEPNRFLSTVQIGITMVGVFAGAYGGQTLAAPVAAALKDWPLIGPHASAVAFGLVILGLTYLSLVIGELVPKRLALLLPEQIACFMAKPMAALARFSSPVVWLLSYSTDALLKLFGLQGSKEQGVTREDVTVLVREGMITGALPQQEGDMLEGVFDLGELTAGDVMTPKPLVVFLQKGDQHEQVWPRIVASNHVYFPVYDETRDRVVGIVSLKSIYANVSAGVSAKISDLMVEPFYVPLNQPALKTLEAMRQARKTVALVSDEFGSVSGMVTVADIFEKVVGDFPQELTRHEPKARALEAGKWMVDGMLDFESLTRLIPEITPAPGEEEEDEYQTVSGFVVHRLQRIPREGDSFVWSGYRFEVIDMDRQRIDKVQVVRQESLAETL